MRGFGRRDEAHVSIWRSVKCKRCEGRVYEEDDMTRNNFSRRDFDVQIHILDARSLELAFRQHVH